MIKGFRLELYDSDIFFAWNTDKQELDNFFTKERVPQGICAFFHQRFNENSTGALTIGYPVTNMLTVFRIKPDNKSIAHEIYHIVYNILKPREIEDEEAWAYCIGYVTSKFYELFNQS